MRFPLALLLLIPACTPAGTDAVDTDAADDSDATDDTTSDDTTSDDTTSDDETDTEALPDLSGWWVSGLATEPSELCGYTGRRFTARTFAADGGSFTVPTTYNPLAEGYTAPCTVDGNVLTCTHQQEIAITNGTVDSRSTTTVTFTDGSADAEMVVEQTCAGAGCDIVTLCNTTVSATFDQRLPPDLSECATPSVPAPQGGGSVTLTGHVSLITYTPGVSGLNTTSDVVVTNDAGSAVTWANATRWSTTTPGNGSGFVRANHNNVHILSTNFQLATWDDLYVNVPMFDRLYVDQSLLTGLAHPSVPGFGHVIVHVREWEDGGIAQWPNPAYKPSLGGRAPDATMAGSYDEHHFANVCPGTVTLDMSYGAAGDCWVESASDAESATSIDLVVEADTVTFVNVRCPSPAPAP